MRFKVYEHRNLNPDAIKLVQEQCFELLVKIDQLCTQHNLQYWIDGGLVLGINRHNNFIPWDDDIDICMPFTQYQKLLDELKTLCSSNQNDYIIYYHDINFIYWHECFAKINLLTDFVFPARIDIFPVKFVPDTESAVKIDNSLANIARLFIKGSPKNLNDILPEHKKFINSFTEQSKKEFFDYYYQYILENEQKLFQQPTDCLVNYISNDTQVVSSRDYFRKSEIFPLKKLTIKNYEVWSPNDDKKYLTKLYGENYHRLPPIEKRVPHITFIENNKHSKPTTKLLLSTLIKKSFSNLPYNKSKYRLIASYIQTSVQTLGVILFILKGKMLSNYIKFSFFRFNQLCTKKSSFFNYM